MRFTQVTIIALGLITIHGLYVIALNIPMLDRVNAPLEAVLDLSVLNKEIKAIIREEVNRGIESSFNNFTKEIRSSVNAISTKLQKNDDDVQLLDKQLQKLEKTLRNHSHANYKTGTCEQGWLNWRNSTCFLFSTEQMDFDSARLRCMTYRGYLAEELNAKTNYFLKQHLDKRSHYIGFTDEEKNNRWVWNDSKNLPLFTDWGAGQPQNNAEHCAAYLSDKRWHDVLCDSKQYFICQKNAF